MRHTVLYLRARLVPAALCAFLASVGGIAFVHWLDDDRGTDITLGVLALAVGAGIAATTFTATDIALERTAAILWPPRRATHVLVAAATLTGTFLVLTRAGTGILPAAVILRDGFGLMGLAALGATVLGRHLAWSLPIGWAAISVLAGSMSQTTTARALTWVVQQPETMAATVVAVTLGVGGTATYAIAGCLRRDR